MRSPQPGAVGHIAISDGRGGGIDSDFGPRTHASVVSFQASCGLVIDGEVGPITTRALGVKLPEARRSRPGER